MSSVKPATGSVEVVVIGSKFVVCKTGVNIRVFTGKDFCGSFELSLAEPSPAMNSFSDGGSMVGSKA